MRRAGSERPDRRRAPRWAGWLVVALSAVAAGPTPLAARGWRALGEGLPAEGQWRQGFDLADLDGDGKLDLVHGPPRRGDGTPVIFRGDGRGGFARWADARFPDLPYDYGAAVAADLDADGHRDVALGCHLRGLTVLRGDGRGGFTRWDQGLELGIDPPGFSSRALGAVDWNADGRLDLVALGEGPAPRTATGSSYGLRVLLNGGDGSWRRLPAADPGRLFGYSLGIADLNRDGRPEVVTSSRAQGLLTVIHSPAPDGGIDRRQLPGARPGSLLHAVTTFDVDGDGAHEVAASYLLQDDDGEWRAGVDLYRPSAATEASRRREILRLDEATEISVVAAGDLDADGRPDLVAGGVGGRIWVFRGLPSGGWRRVRSGAIERASGRCKAAHAILADVDGEPGDELVIAFAEEPSKESCPTGGSIQVWKRR